MCAARTSEDIWYQRYEECSRSHPLKIYSIFSCSCECSKRIKCSGGRVVDPKHCGCVCPTKTCTRPKYFSHHTCDCECPHNRYRCHGGQTYDRNTCQCKCTRTCQDHEELDSRRCYCIRKAPLTRPPPRLTNTPPRFTQPPITLTPPPKGSRCSHQSNHYSCKHLRPYHGGPCQ